MVRFCSGEKCIDEKLNYDFNLSRTPTLPPTSSRTADKRPSRPRIIQTLDDDDGSGDEIIELTDSSVELTPSKVNYKRKMGERNSSVQMTPVYLGGDESIIVL
jgi:hypothetical protein